MALVKIKELRSLSDDELKTAIADTKRELFDLRFQKATRQLETGFHQFKHNKRKLAQLLTLERERDLAAEAASDTSGGTSAAETATEAEEA